MQWIAYELMAVQILFQHIHCRQLMIFIGCIVKDAAFLLHAAGIPGEFHLPIFQPYAAPGHGHAG